MSFYVFVDMSLFVCINVWLCRQLNFSYGGLIKYLSIYLSSNEYSLQIQPLSRSRTFNGYFFYYSCPLWAPSPLFMLCHTQRTPLPASTHGCRAAGEVESDDYFSCSSLAAHYKCYTTAENLPTFWTNVMWV